jgi:hypothetical protein
MESARKRTVATSWPRVATTSAFSYAEPFVFSFSRVFVVSRTPRIRAHHQRPRKTESTKRVPGSARQAVWSAPIWRVGQRRSKIG